MVKLTIQELNLFQGLVLDAPWERTISPLSAARIPTATHTAGGASAISSSQRLLYWRVCKARCSEFKGTPFFNSKLPHDKVLAVLEHLAEGCGVRQTARLVGVNKDTVTRLALLAGQHAKDTHDEEVAYSPRDTRGSVR